MESSPKLGQHPSCRTILFLSLQWMCSLCAPSLTFCNARRGNQCALRGEERNIFLNPRNDPSKKPSICQERDPEKCEFAKCLNWRFSVEGFQNNWGKRDTKYSTFSRLWPGVVTSSPAFPLLVALCWEREGFNLAFTHRVNLSDSLLKR